MRMRKSRGDTAVFAKGSIGLPSWMINAWVATVAVRSERVEHPNDAPMARLDTQMTSQTEIKMTTRQVSPKRRLAKLGAVAVFLQLIGGARSARAAVEEGGGSVRPVSGAPMGKVAVRRGVQGPE